MYFARADISSKVGDCSQSQSVLNHKVPGVFMLVQVEFLLSSDSRFTVVLIPSNREGGSAGAGEKRGKRGKASWGRASAGPFPSPARARVGLAGARPGRPGPPHRKGGPGQPHKCHTHATNLLLLFFESRARPDPPGPLRRAKFAPPGRRRAAPAPSSYRPSGVPSESPA